MPIKFKLQSIENSILHADKGGEHKDQKHERTILKFLSTVRKEEDL
jgi:hypothetical protein